jgi:hypothetical protein
MKFKIFFILILLPSSFLLSQTSLQAFGSEISYVEPDSSVWRLVENEFIAERKMGYSIYKHSEIEDNTGRMIIPNIAVVYEWVSDSTDLIVYSVLKGKSAKFSITKVLGPVSKAFSYENAVGYEGIYRDKKDSTIVHRVIIGYLIHKNIGVQAICDATEGVYEKVESDFRNFLRSFSFK